MIHFSRGGTGPIPKSFSLTRRYINDLITSNNLRFDGAIGEIYPSAITLRETNLSDHRDAYLNRQLEIEKGILVMSLYDKRHDSPSGYKIIPIFIAMSLYGVYISATWATSPFRSRR